MKLFTFFITFFTTTAHASWLCDEASSRWRGSDVEACGIGEAATESAARELAYRAARAEFRRLCADSVDCRGRDADVEPGRTECMRGNSVTCHRLLIYHLGRRTAPGAAVKKHCVWIMPKSVYCRLKPDNECCQED